MNKELEILSEITIYNKYAKYIPELQRRETWGEIVERNKKMHVEKFPNLKNKIDEAYKLVLDKKLLPSMRSLQFAGKPIAINNARIFNCAYLPIDDYRCFSEIMFLLLSGCGVGYSVQYDHIDKLPEITKPTKHKRYLVGDSIEGWADAVRILMKSYFGKSSALPNFDFGDIRPKGAQLLTSGGKAPGAEPLKECLFQIQKILDRKENGDKLKSIEAHDICCHIADAVLSGGIRRAALIALFNADDEDMLTSKFGNWWEENPQRGRANNSAVLLRHKIKKKFFLDLWKKVEYSNSGEPGIIWSNDTSMGTNPCITKDTWVTTNNGPKMVGDLLNKPSNLLLNGTFYPTTDCGFIETGFKPVYELKLINGNKIKATLNHKFLTKDGWKELKDINTNDKIILSNNQNVKWDSEDGNLEEGWLIGNLIGDGTFNNESAILQYWGDNKYDLKQIAHAFLKNNTKYCGKLNLEDTEYSEKYNKTLIQSKELGELAKHWDVYKGNKTITDKIEMGSVDFYKGIIGGLFDADGSVYISNGGVSIDINQSNLPLLEKIQRMLLRLGIPSKITLANKEGLKLLPGPKFYEDGSLKEYYCKNNYILRISTKDNIIKFFETIFIKDNKKISKYKELISKYLKSSYKKNQFISQVSSISYVGEETVYDCTVPTTSCFDANGIITHNCAEIALKSYQFCNLCEVNVSDIESQEDLNNRVKYAAFLGTLQASYTNFHYLRDIWKKTTEKDALIGIGMTGIGSGKIMQYNLREAAEIVKQENELTAKEIGIHKAARCTTVKPSGTSSLVLGTASGIHAWHADYYIRRMRLGKNESLYTYLQIYHPELLEDDFFKPTIQSIISVPQRAPQNSVLRTENVLDFLERVKKFNIEWVQEGHRSGSNFNNVSATTSVKPEEWEQVGKWIWDNRDTFNGISVLPFDNGSYIQAPFEDCTKEKYEEMVKHLHNIDLSKVVEIVDSTDLKGELACAGGSCEVI